jgi:ABC-type sugar transport system substrate-binding protein
MGNKKRIGSIIMAAAMAAGMSFTAVADDVELPEHYYIAAAQASEEPIEIKFCYYSNNPFWDLIKDGLNDVTDYLANYNCTVTPVDMGSEADGKTIADYIETLELDEPAGIVCAPMSDGTEAYIDKAVSDGITVATYLSESTQQTDTRICFVGSDAVAGGETAAGLAADFTGGEGTVGVITGYLTMNQHEERRNGFTDKLTELSPDLEILEPVEAHDSATETYDAAVDLITAYPDLKVIYCTAGGPYGAAQAVKDRGKTGEIGVICFDWVPDNLEYVKTGEIIGAVSQDPENMAWMSTMSVFNYVAAGVEPESTHLITESDLVTPDTLAEKVPEYAGSETETE